MKGFVVLAMMLMICLMANIGIASSLSSFVAYTIPGCGHCDALKPQWAQMEAAVEGTHEGVRIEKIDCSGERKAECEGIHSFPTLKYNGEAYTGSRNADALTKFVRKISGDAVRLGGRAAWLAADVNGTAIVAEGICDSDVEEAFGEAATWLRHRMYFVRDRNTARERCVIEAVRQWVNETEVWDPSLGSLNDWAEQQQYPIIAPFDKYLHSSSKASVAFLFYEKPLSSAANANALNAMREASLALRHRKSGARSVLFATMDVAEWDGLRTGITSKYPQAVIVDHSKLNHHYPFQDTDWTRFPKWIDAYVEGQVERTLVSAPEEKGVLVSKNFISQVAGRQDEKDVLVFFGSQHCGSSNGFRPTWNALVQSLKENYDAHGLEILEADGWANDWPDTGGIVGLPDIRLFPGDDRSSSVRFSGKRTVNDLITWLQEKCFNTITKRVDKLHQEL